MTAAPTRRRTGFTLIEVLVVISLLAMLIAVLLPGLVGAKESARSAICLSNLRAFVIAANAYGGSNDGYFPLAYYSISTPQMSVQACWDFKAVKDWKTRKTTVVPGILWEGSAAAKIQQCPSFQGRSNSTSDPYTGYNYNTSYVGHGDRELVRRPARLEAVLEPAGTALFGDGQYVSGADKYMRAPLDNSQEQCNMRYAGTQGFRHRGATNVAFADGHAASWTQRFTVTDSGSGNVAAGTGFLSADNSLYDLE